jgi:hypothetical protein
MPLTTTPAASAPPVKAARAAKPKVIAASADVTAARAKAISDLSAIPTMACLATGQLADAATIQMYWPRMSAEIAKLANSQAQIAAVADRLMIVGPYAGLLAVIGPMALQFAVNHKRVPVGTGGTQSPDSLSAQLKAEIARAEVESLKAQMDAERESRELAAEYERMTATEGHNGA